jgi:hypothetical protein
MKQKISNSILVILIIGIPMALAFIYYNMPKVQTQTVVIEQEIEEVKIEPVIEEPEVEVHIKEKTEGRIGEYDFSKLYSDAYPRLKLYWCLVTDLRNYKCNLNEYDKESRKDFIKLSQYFSVSVSSIEWIDDPDYPTLYTVECEVLDNDSQGRAIILTIKTFAPINPNIREMDQIRMNNKFYPIFNIKNYNTVIELEVID